MSACKWMADMLLAMFTVYLFFLYFGMFFERRKKNIRVLLGVIVLVLWQVGIPEVINELPKAWNIGTTVGLALFVVANVFEGKAWMKSFFAVTFAAIWMLAEMLIGSVLMIYGESIVERQIFGAFASRFLFFLIILALRKVFTNEKVTGLPTGYSILIIFIPTGSIYIMNAVFVLAYRTDWEYAERYSLVSGLILLFINVLIFYIYIRLADDLRIRRMNLVYEQHVETVVLLSQQKPDDTIEIDLDLDELDATSAELKATYQEIKDYVLKEFGLKVSSLYISQVKRKCGIEVGENYNLPKSENARVPQCPKEKEDAIKAALKYYAMI